MNYILKAYGLQDIGKRDNQEDCFFPPFIDPCHCDDTTREWSFYDGTPHTDDRLFILCDGMGGHDHGEFASQLVTKTMSESLLRSSTIEGSFDDNKLQEATDEAFHVLCAEDSSGEENSRKMGTTMTALKFHADGATVGHVGDSRVYHFRPATDKEPAKILFHTEDHTVVNNKVRLGLMTAEEAATSPQRHILSAAITSVKNFRPKVEIHRILDIQPGDIFLLCSDGIYENLSDDELCSLICNPNYNGSGLAQLMLKSCIDNRDNHTAIIVIVEGVMNTSADTESRETLPPNTVLNSGHYAYHVEKVLGHGAFGITYLVNTDVTFQGQLGTLHTGAKFAMKEFFMHSKMKRHGNEVVTVSHEDDVSVFRNKFRNEALQIAKLSHPNIVKVLEVFEANGTIYYIMEYFPDGSLNDYINEHNGVPEQEALKYIREIGLGLSYMHSNKMLHLDVKPANIMRDESKSILKLIDFGLAKRYEDNGKATSSACIGAGTVGYAPLEQANDKVELGFSPQLDVYALGATYYKILTGSVPNTAIDVLNNGLDVVPLIRKNVSNQSIKAIKEAMQPSAKNRLKTIQEFLNMLPRIDDTTVFKPKKDNKWTYYAMMMLINILVLAIAIYIIVVVF